MQNFKPYKITAGKPHLKVSRPLLTFNTCTICNTQLTPEHTEKHCTHCKERIQTLKTNLNQIKQNNEKPTCNNISITDNHSDNSSHNPDTTKGI